VHVEHDQSAALAGIVQVLLSYKVECPKSSAEQLAATPGVLNALPPR
jgi:hypothetical protein